MVTCDYWTLNMFDVTSWQLLRLFGLVSAKQQQPRSLVLLVSTRNTVTHQPMGLRVCGHRLS